MSYEIITPDGENLYLRISVDTKDTLENRKIVHKIRILTEQLKGEEKE